jgi:hypothetical protein
MTDQPRKYRPSNGTEGAIFHDEWCYTCCKCPIDQDAANQCKILAATFIFSVNDPEYPKQWVYIDGKPACTAYKSRDDHNAERRKKGRGIADKLTGEMF